MIIVTGTVKGSDETIDELLELSLEHVRRSRLESGCLSHDVSLRVEAPTTVTFVERWSDMPALKRHFAVPESGTTVKRMAELAVEPPTLELYDSTALPFP